MSYSIMKPCLLAVFLSSAGLLTACGGGGGSGSVASPNSSPTTSAGTISGLGSVILNGIRYETIGASVLDADDNRVIQSPFGLGMTVSIETLPSSATTARTIHVQSGIQGGTSAVNSTTKTLNVSGLPVFTDATTFIVNDAGTVGSFADLPNSQVEVYGLPQSDGTFKATRIEIKAIAPFVQLVGVVSNLNTANSTLTLGNSSNTVTVSYASATAPAGLANGTVVSVHTLATATASSYAASGLYLRSTNLATFNQYATHYAGTSRVGNEANELYGMVSSLTPTVAGCTLQVQGIPTSLASAALCTSIQNGDYVEVKGLLRNGMLAASRLEFKSAGGDRSLPGYSDDSNDSDGDDLKYSRLLTATSSSSSNSPSSRYTSESSSSYEIYGTLQCAASTCTLTSNGTVLVADLSTATWEHGAVTSGWVEAKGYMSSATGFKVTKIESKR
jgi:hypothetical protein